MKALTCRPRARQNAVIQRHVPHLVSTHEPFEAFRGIIPMKALGELHAVDWTPPDVMSPAVVDERYIEVRRPGTGHRSTFAVLDLRGGANPGTLGPASRLHKATCHIRSSLTSTAAALLSLSGEQLSAFSVLLAASDDEFIPEGD